MALPIRRCSPNVNVARGKVSQYLIPWDKLDIGPRIGVAYNIRPKTVIRAAYGIFYGGEEQQGGNPNRGESAPFNESPQLSRPAGVGSFAPDPYFANGNAAGGISIGYPTQRLHYHSRFLLAIPGSCKRLPQSDGPEMELRGARGITGTNGAGSRLPGKSLRA